MIIAKNFDMLLYGFEKAYSKLEEMSMSLGKYNENDAFYIIGTSIHWAIDCYERIEKAEILNEEDKSRVSALRFANNCLKHNVSFFDFQRKAEGATFPQSLDGSGRFWNYEWKDLNDINDSRYQNQKNNYDKILKGKSILYTFREDLKIIKEYQENLNRNL